MFKRLAVFCAVLLVAGFVLAAAVGMGTYFYFASDLPRITSLRDYRPATITEIYADNGKIIGQFYLEKRKIIPIEEIPEQLKKAFIASEDARFYEHQGLDFMGIMRALIKNISAGRVVQGGSTITQQVTKSLLLSPERKLKRKIKEAILAYRIEKYLSKDEILFLYLNQIYLGHGAYGVEIASQTYFGKKTRDLTLAEMTLIAGLPKAPNRYSPLTNPELAARRQRYVLGQMVKEGYISAAESREALASPVEIRQHREPFIKAPYFTEHIRRYLEKEYGYDLLYREGLQVYSTVNLDFQQAARDAIIKGLGALDRRQGYRGPLQIVSPDDFATFEQQLADEHRSLPVAAGQQMKALVKQVDDQQQNVMLSLGGLDAVMALKDCSWARRPAPDGALFPGATIKSPSAAFVPGDVVLVEIIAVADGAAAGNGAAVAVRLVQEPLVQGALVALDVQTGMVRSMVGGKSFAESEFNRAIQSRRSPGSAFKPIIYAAGLDHGLTPASIFLDSPIIYQDSEEWDQVWKPRNYEQKFYGPTSLRQALIHSRNLVTIKVLQKTGIPRVINYASKLGITSPLNADLTLALGSSGVSLMELTRAYGVFANGGRLEGPVYIKRIENRDGEILEDNEPFWGLGGDDGANAMLQGAASSASEPRKQVISPQTAYLMTSMMESVVQQGTGRRARVLKRPLAGKTGTTNDYYDAWFLGYAPQLVTGVWVGFDDLKPLGKHETGSRAACPIWVDFMREALKEFPKTTFPVPPGIVFAKIDQKTGLLATPETEQESFECFREGTEPKEFSRPISAHQLEEQLFQDFPEENSPPLPPQ
ncbi:MAG: PBP1A family penicillin-binding protein [Deltaproteobacteria bacterium]|nr:PBP1A family penicillin-binding protein [Candidatus Anaeroferrophillus wilburensis]MBN2889309.1 PBP1A family penicillin-binding protein [Deltaproteobacteria bacterium]